MQHIASLDITTSFSVFTMLRYDETENEFVIYYRFEKEPEVRWLKLNTDAKYEFVSIKNNNNEIKIRHSKGANEILFRTVDDEPILQIVYAMHRNKVYTIIASIDAKKVTAFTSSIPCTIIVNE